MRRQARGDVAPQRLHLKSTVGGGPPMGAPGSDEAIARIMKWAGRNEWRELYEQIIDAHLGPLLEDGNLKLEDLAGLLGDDFNALLGCATEDFLSCRFEPDQRNVVEDYLTRRGSKETAPVRRHLRALQESVMSLYEVIETAPQSHLVVRDLIRDGDAVRVEDGRRSHTLAASDHLAARILPIGERHYMSESVLVLSADDAAEILGAVGEMRTTCRQEVERAAEAEGGTEMPVDERMLDDVLLTEFAPLLTHVWLRSRLERLVGPSPAGGPAHGDS